MGYQVLARKWRPSCFAEMVGQNHVQRVLINALDSQRLHHAYLFTGTRGVGKTTVARIFAKSLNCERGVSATPCGQCDVCREVAEGRFVDLIEVDAASRTRVEETRELLDNVQYAPTRGRYKVYLIDEVHMLSNSSFNALLKTLEEPPQHVKFLLATTDPQKIPATILSRCLQFNLKRLSLEQISTHFAKILTEEQVVYDEKSLFYLAKAADGSMRDGLSLLDQAIAFGNGALNAEDTATMLGALDQDLVIGIVDALATGDAEQTMARVAAAAEFSPDYGQLLDEVLSLLQRIALAQAVPTALDSAHPDTPAVLQLAQRIRAEDVQLFYQIAILGRRDLPFSPQPRGGLEMILLRMLAFRPVDGPVGTPPATRPVSLRAVADTPPAVNAPTVVLDEWHACIQPLNLSGFTKQLAEHCVLQQRTDEAFHLALPARHAALLQDARVAELEKQLSAHLATTVRLKIRVERGNEPPTALPVQVPPTREAQAPPDPTVQALEQAFEAKIIDIKKLE